MVFNVTTNCIEGNTVHQRSLGLLMTALYWGKKGDASCLVNECKLWISEPHVVSISAALNTSVSVRCNIFQGNAPSGVNFIDDLSRPFRITFP